MIKNSKIYDYLKWFALIGTNAMSALILTLGQIWSWDWSANVGATISAIGLFVGACIGISNSNYNAEYGEILGEAQHRIAEMQDEYVGEIFDDEEVEEDE